MPLYNDQAVVLRNWKLGEADKIISLYGVEHGKIRAVAKGVRKTKTKFGARLEPISYLKIQCWEGSSELHIVSQVESIELFPRIKSDLELLRKGLAIVEVIEELIGDSTGDIEIFKLLVRALDTLERRDSPYLLSGFLWRLLQVEGVSPELSCCVECGEPEGLEFFSNSGSGLVCSSHGSAKRISKGAIEVISYISQGEVARALALGDSPVRLEVEELAISQVENLISHKVKALHLGSY
ncbi:MULTISPECIES: DNA repair protein RecO [Acidithrix]|uniref:DNA repair protein RecO n=2 Tax=root TaxID=1 RepID=A0A0D8HEW7_9ACTN|nr:MULTISPECIES: DNA repair protein RecO [Acidithrix]KJF16510.1 DNA repair protein RecO [Acidithrix ferrooxidans]CAG4928816.1 unnamed protein product [Acidithrix sp. C25]